MSLRRLTLLLPAGVALVLGVNAGLGLMGLPSAAVSERLPAVHGFLLVLGFVGTLIALERAVALRRPVGFAFRPCSAPAASSSSARRPCGWAKPYSLREPRR